MYATIDLKNKVREFFGAHAAYFKLSARRGVRVYGAGEFSPSGGFGVLRQADIDWSEVQRDFKFIRRIQCSIVPKVYRIVSIRWRGNWYAGLVMEHVRGVELDKHFEEYGFVKGEVDTKLSQIGKEFTKLTGYIHRDLHGGNVMFNRKTNSYRVIDLTMDYATRTKKAA